MRLITIKGQYTFKGKMRECARMQRAVNVLQERLGERKAQFTLIEDDVVMVCLYDKNTFTVKQIKRAWADVSKSYY